MRQKSVRDRVVVITGASSGIGRATALALASEGASLVLVSRREEALKDLAQECERLGGQAMAARVDVTDSEAVKSLAQDAVSRFGRIDVWINNAAVSLFGRIEETPLEDYKQVIDTNILGNVHGIRAVLPYFREQGRGHMIIVSSVVGKIGQPYTSAYVLTKFALLGLAECLRMEMRVTGAKNVRVSAILPPSTDTPLFQSAANYTGRAVKPMRPLYHPDTVAQAILKCIQNPEREVLVGGAAKIMAFLRTLLPSLAERQMARKVEKDHFQNREVSKTSGNLYEPMKEFATVTGGWAGRKRVKSIAALVPLMGFAVGALFYFRRREPQRQRELFERFKQAA